MVDLKNFGFLALGVSLVFAAPVAAEDEAEEPVQQVEEENPNERICRRVRVTGSNLRQRVCMSRAEWTGLREQSQEDVRQARDDQLVNQGGAASN